MTRRVLVLYAHPAHDRSRANRALRSAIDGLSGVSVHDLYEDYPDLIVDVDREQALLLKHDVIVFQHPMYWYSAPALLKEWQDSVLELGWAYGDGGTQLQGKSFMQAVTTGGLQGTYRIEGKAHVTIRDLLRPFEQMANYCGMRVLDPFVTYNARRASVAELEAQSQRYIDRIEALVSGDSANSAAPASPREH